MRSRMRASATRQLSSRLHVAGSSGAPCVGPGKVPGRQACQRLVLGANEGRDHAQEALELVALRQFLQSLGAAREDRDEVGQLDGIALGDVAQNIFGRDAQGLPTSWRNHLRWCFQLQPRVTEPRVMARKVPLTQMTA